MAALFLLVYFYRLEYAVSDQHAHCRQQLARQSGSIGRRKLAETVDTFAQSLGAVQLGSETPVLED